MTLIDSLYFGLKREFWEHRRAVFWAPIGFSLIMLLGLVTINVVWGPTAEPSIEIGNQEQESGQIPKKDATTQQRQIERQQSRNPSRKSFAYLTLAWLVSVFYLLSALHSDRKDKSITFWKSLPVSETQNVIHKLVFAVLCFPIVALAISWVLYFVLMVFQIEGIQSINEGEAWAIVERSFDVHHMIVVPLIGIVAGTLWGLPLFCYALMVSAMAKKYPFLLFIVPLIALVFVERMTFQGSQVLDFFVEHSPFSILIALSDSPDLSNFFQSQFAEKIPTLLLGCGLALCFLGTAIWYRNHRFEI